MGMAAPSWSPVYNKKRGGGLVALPLGLFSRYPLLETHTESTADGVSAVLHVTDGLKRRDAGDGVARL